MADLRTDYKDDVLNITTNERRKYRMIPNADGTVSFEDVTDYMQNGDSFGATDVNTITERVNRSLTGADVVDNLESTAADLPLSANVGRELYNSSLKVITQSWSGNSTIGTAIKLCDIGDILQDKIYVGTVVLTSSGYSSIDNGVIRMHENTSLYYIPQTTQEGLTVVYNILYV